MPTEADRELIARALLSEGTHKSYSSLFHARADRILAALADAGRVIVPVEPTEAMILAAMKEAERQGVATDIDSPPLYFGEVYRAMLAQREAGDD